MSIFKKIIGKLDYLNRKISFYVSTTLESIEDFNVTHTYCELDEIDAIKKFNFEFMEEEYRSRLSKKHVFCGLFNNENVLVSYGWLNPTNSHYLGELDLLMELPDQFDMLYDFHTFKPHRGKGLYPALLKYICKRDSKLKLIYVFPDNVSSVKGILKANFNFIGNLSGYNKKKYLKILKQND